MHDCKAYDAEPTAAHNRVGERRLDSVNYILRRMGGLNVPAGRDVTRLSARIKHHWLS